MSRSKEQKIRLQERTPFLSEEVVELSKWLLGKRLVSVLEGVRTAGRIVEVEAYGGATDKACHAHLNRRTRRTEIMYAPGGHAYVYLCYGIHHLFNIVTAPEGIPHAVLVRGIEPLENVEKMMERRNLDKLEKRLSAGPGVLTQAMGITTEQDGIDLLQPGSPLWLEDGEAIAEKDIVAAPRIGIDYAEECADWPWRFYIRGNRWVSKK
jgi:DNA-3-methyladenine glycosylase